MRVCPRMSVCRFEDLRVWQAAKRQCDRVGELIKRTEFRAQFLRYSFASNGELKAGYYAADGRKYVTAAEAVELIELNESIAKMLRRWQATLKTREPTTKRR
jgi:hypothetical protein